MSLIRKIEQISFKDSNTGNYLDIVVNEGYLDISINDDKEAKLSIDLEDWGKIDKEIRNIFTELESEDNNSGI